MRFENLIIFTAVIGVAVCTFIIGFNMNEKDCDCKQINRTDWTGNIQGDTICKPEEKISGGNYNRF